MIRRLVASKGALIVAVALVAGVAIAVPTTVFAATTPGGLLAVFTGKVPSPAPEELDGVKSDGAGEIAEAPAKPTPVPTPTPKPTEESKPKPTEESKPKPTEESKPKPTEESKPKPTPDPAYQVEDPAVARAAFDAHRSGSGLPALATYNGNDCTKVGYAAAKSLVGSAAPSAVILAESEWLVLSAADEGRITTAKVNGWYDESGRWRVDLSVYDCAA